MNNITRVETCFGLHGLQKRPVERLCSIEAQVRTGHFDMDRSLGGGMARGKVHEIFAIDAVDASSATGFVAMLALQLGGLVVWLREERNQQRGRLHIPGLVEIGLDPARLIMGLPPDPLALLCAAADVVRCPGVSVAIVELWGNPAVLDLTATRRLALAAELSRVTVLLLRIQAHPAPSAAQTRWVVQSATSQPMEANAPGRPALDIALVRQRGRPAGLEWRVEWDRDRAIFIDPGQQALSGTVVPLPAHGSVDAGQADGIVAFPQRRTG